jgi:starvation-inducible DNA-binding protein
MSIGRFQELSVLDEPPGVVSAEEMVAELMQDNAKIIELFNQVFKFADSANEQGLADFIAGRLDAHKKHAWMLRATSKSG